MANMNVHFIQGNRRSLIGKLPSGKIILLDKNSEESKNVLDDDTWEVEIIKDLPKCIIAKPIKKIGISNEDIRNQVRNTLRRLSGSETKVLK